MSGGDLVVLLVCLAWIVMLVEALTGMWRRFKARRRREQETE